MATLGKNGYSYTGYTEPFIAPVVISATGAIASKDMGVNGITGAVAIEYTEFRNAGLYVRSHETAAGATSFTSKDLNIDTRMDDGFTTVGTWVISDDYEPGVVELDSSNNVTVDSITYDNVTGLYTVDLTAQTMDVVAGKVYKVIARVLDLGTTVSAGYVAGEKVVEPYTPDERLYTQP